MIGSLEIMSLQVRVIHQSDFSQEVKDVGIRVIQCLDDSLRPSYRGFTNPLLGHCYIASEAAYHLMGGKQEGWTPQHYNVDGVSHWYLRDSEGRVLDLTALQFPVEPDYSQGTGKGFLTSKPSKRAQEIIRRTTTFAHPTTQLYKKAQEILKGS